MITLSTTMMLFALAGDGTAMIHPSMTVQPPTCHVQSCGKRHKIAKSKSRLFLSAPIRSGVDDEYDDDDTDEITIQSILKLREVKPKKADMDINDEVAERLSMIKWIVLLRLANPDLHKT